MSKEKYTLQQYAAMQGGHSLDDLDLKVMV